MNGEALKAMVETGEENSRENYSRGVSENDAEESDNGVSTEHKGETVLPDAHIRRLKDQLIRANIYLSLPGTRSNSQLLRELRVRVKDVLRVLGDATRDSELPRKLVFIVLCVSIFKYTRFRHLIKKPPTYVRWSLAISNLCVLSVFFSP